MHVDQLKKQPLVLHVVLIALNMNLNRKDHLVTLISSIDIMFNNAKNKGIIRNKELYLLNLINKLINYDGVNIINDHSKKDLSDFYFRLVAIYKDIICRTLPKKCYSYQNHLNISHVPDECYDFPHTNKIIYWQSEDLSERFDDILPQITPGYLSDKIFDTKTNFIIGVNCDYTSIGVISFFVLETLETDSYRVYDTLNNDVTDLFTIAWVDSINGTLITSNNIYSISIINIKIKKI